MFITYSSLSCFQQCHRKYKLRYMDCIVPKVKSTALEFGSAMHIALEQYFKHIQASQAFQDVTEECKFSFDCNKILTNKIEAAKLSGLLRGYIRKWYSEDVANYEVISIEKEFKVMILWSDFIGKVDGILREKASGKYYILEHKTASMVDESYIAQKDIDSQTLDYAIAIEILMGIEISGAIHDIITKQKIRQKKGESEEDFCKRLEEDVTDDNFTRIQIDFTREQLVDSLSELKGQIQEIYECDRFHKCTGACLGRFGACEYLPICRAGGLVDSIKDRYETVRPHEEISEETVSNQ